MKPHKEYSKTKISIQNTTANHTKNKGHIFDFYNSKIITTFKKDS